MGDTKQSRRRFMKGAGLAVGSVLGATVVPEAGAAQGVQRSASQTPRTRAARFRAGVESPQGFVLPVVTGVMMARLCELEGFTGGFMGGSGFAAQYALPNFSLGTLTEVMNYMNQVIENTDLPILADAEDGGGSPVIVYRVVQGFERAGAACIMIEDAVDPRTHFNSKGAPVASAELMVNRVKAAVDARKDQDMMILVRSDAPAKGLSRTAHARSCCSMCGGRRRCVLPVRLFPRPAAEGKGASEEAAHGRLERSGIGMEEQRRGHGVLPRRIRRARRHSHGAERAEDHRQVRRNGKDEAGSGHQCEAGRRGGLARTREEIRDDDVRRAVAETHNHRRCGAVPCAHRMRAAGTGSAGTHSVREPHRNEVARHDDYVGRGSDRRCLTPRGSRELTGLPAFCRVVAMTRPAVKFEVWLPLDTWNGKFQGVGNGANAGTIGYGAMVNALKRGYATASTDTGHQTENARDGEWAMGHPELVADFGYRAIHVTAENGKKIVNKFYSEPAKHSYPKSASYLGSGRYGRCCQLCVQGALTTPSTPSHDATSSIPTVPPRSSSPQCTGPLLDRPALHPAWSASHQSGDGNAQRVHGRRERPWVAA